jgi:ribose transport system ATP-binding protein
MRLGVGYVTPDRQEEGVLGGLPLGWNITLASLAQRSRHDGFISPRREARMAREYVEKLRIKAPGVHTLAANLSGGNQQKVVIARWLAFGVRVLLLDNPTRGIDAGAKEEIYELVRELTEQGVAIVLVSDDLLELIGLANRILVMRDGRIVREVASRVGEKPHEADLVGAMV